MKSLIDIFNERYDRYEEKKMFSKLLFTSVPYHGSIHETETPETLGFSLNNMLGIREGLSQSPTPKPAL